VGKLEWGDSSRTDAVLTRHYDPETGEEVREREVTIYLRRHAAVEDVALDLAHELVHAAQQPTWDPYDPDLTPVRFIRLSIEAAGGEADAVQAECQVAAELGDAVATSGERCGRYAAGAREGIVREFYRVGAWKRVLDRALGATAGELADLSGEEPLLLSSTGRAPYPVALLREYEALTEAACRNSRKRLVSSSSARSAQTRGPAGDGAGRDLDEPSQRAAVFLSRRCGGDR